MSVICSWDRIYTLPNQDLGQRGHPIPPWRTFNTLGNTNKQWLSALSDPMVGGVWWSAFALSHSLTLSSCAHATKRATTRAREREEEEFFPSAAAAVHSFKKEPRFRLCRCHLAWRRVRIHRQPRSLVRSQQPPPSRRGSPALARSKNAGRRAPLFKNTADAFWNRFVPNFRWPWPSTTARPRASGKHHSAESVQRALICMHAPSSFSPCQS